MVDKRLKREEINLLSKKEKLDYFMNCIKASDSVFAAP